MDFVRFLACIRHLTFAALVFVVSAGTVFLSKLAIEPWLFFQFLLYSSIVVALGMAYGFITSVYYVVRKDQEAKNVTK